MNRYLLLDKPVADSDIYIYRGTFRPGPVYVDALPMESAINQLWMEETDLMIDDFVSLKDARRVQEVYADANIYLDLVQVVDHKDVLLSSSGPEFMGCDISHVSGYSLLSWNLMFEEPAPNFFHKREVPDYQPLLILIEKYFRPRLNVYGLLPTVEIADFFLQVTTALTLGFTSVWEAPQYGKFIVVQMFMVRSREEMARVQNTVSDIVTDNLELDEGQVGI